METYFDFLPIELLATCIPEDGLYDFIQMKFIYKNFTDMELLFNYLLIRHPYYFKIMNREMKELHHIYILRKLLKIINKNEIRRIIDLPKLLWHQEIFQYSEEGLRELEMVQILYPFSLKYEYLKKLEILLNDPDVINYSTNIGKFFYDLFIQLTLSYGQSLQIFIMNMPDKLIIKILKLLDLEGFSIEGSDLENISNIEIKQLLINNKIHIF